MKQRALGARIVRGGLGDYYYSEVTYQDGSRYVTYPDGTWEWWNAQGHLADGGKFDYEPKKTDWTPYLVIGGAVILALAVLKRR